MPKTSPLLISNLSKLAGNKKKRKDNKPVVNKKSLINIENLKQAYLIYMVLKKM